MTNQDKLTFFKIPSSTESKMSISEKIENLKKVDPEIIDKMNPNLFKKIIDAHSFNFIPSKRKYKEYRKGKIVEIEEGECDPD